MRTGAIGLLLALSQGVQAQARAGCEHDPRRSAAIGAALGVVAIVGPALIRDRDHRITSNEWVPYAWGATGGIVLGASVGLLHARCPPRMPSFPDTAHCGKATLRGAGGGLVAGGVGGFLMAPILALPLALTWRQYNGDHVVGLITATGATLGMVGGAVHEAVVCTDARTEARRRR